MAYGLADSCKLEEALRLLRDAKGQAKSSQNLARLHREIGSIYEALGDFAAAQRSYRLGLEALASTEHLEAPRIWVEQSLLIMKGGDLRGAEDKLREAESVFAELRGTPSDFGRLKELQAHTERLSGHPEDAEALFLESLDSFQADQNIRGLASASDGLGNTLDQLKKHSEAKRRFRNALKFAGQSGSKRIRLRVCINAGNLALRMGEYDNSQRFLEDGKLLAQDCSDPDLEASATNGMAFVHATKGRLDLARREFLRAKHLFDQVGDIENFLKVQHNLFSLAVRMGGSPERLSAVRAWAAFGEHRQFPEVSAFLQTSLAEAELCTDHLIEAREAIERSLEHRRSIGDPLFVLNGEIILAEVERRAGDIKAAIKITASDLPEGLEELKSLQERILLEEVRSGIRATEGSFDVAYDLALKALNIAREHRRFFDHARIQAKLGGLHFALGEPDNAREILNKAKEEFEALRLPMWRQFCREIESAKGAAPLSRQKFFLAPNLDPVLENPRPFD